MSPPSAEDQLMLALLRPDPPEPAALAGLRDVAQDRLRSRLIQFRVLGLLGSRLLAWAPPGMVSEEFARAVDDAVAGERQFGMRNAILTWALLRVLAEAGIEAVPLKGPLFAQRLYGDPGLRPSRDVDLLVHRRDLQRAVSVLSGLDYLPTESTRHTPLIHHKLAGPAFTPVELHWRVHWNDAEHAERMLKRARRSDELLELTTTDDLIALLLVYARDGLIGLRGLADIAQWWWHYHDRLDAEDFAATVAAFPRLEASIRAAAMMAERVAGVPLTRYLPTPIRARRRTRLAVGIAADGVLAYSGDPDTVPKLVDGLLVTPPGVGGFLRRTFLPPLEGEGRKLAVNRVLYDIGLVRRVGELSWRWARGQRIRPV